MNIVGIFPSMGGKKIFITNKYSLITCLRLPIQYDGKFLFPGRERVVFFSHLLSFSWIENCFLDHKGSMWVFIPKMSSESKISIEAKVIAKQRQPTEPYNALYI